VKLFRAEQRATPPSFSLRQLGIALGVDPVSPSVGSIDEAIRDAATWACIKIKAQGCAMLPISEVRYQGSQRVVVEPSPIIRRPSNIVPARVWRFQVFASMFSDGNAFGLVSRTDSMGRPTQIELVAPEQVRERRVVDGVPQVKINNETHLLYPWGDLWHLAGEMTLAGSPFGLSPIAYGANTTGTSLAAERFGGQFFTRGGHPTGVLTVPGQPSEEQTTALKQRLMAVIAGSREPLVLPEGTSYEKMQVDPKDSQFLELMRFEVEQTCRRHGVPPSMVFGAVSGQSITYANATQADLAYLKHTLSYPIDLFEDGMNLLTPAPRSIFLDRDAILEGDPMGRLEMQIKRVQNRLRTINEVRAEDHLDDFGPEYDEPGVPADSSSRDLSLPEQLQKIYLAVDKVITANEAREIVGIDGEFTPATSPADAPDSPSDESGEQDGSDDA